MTLTLPAFMVCLGGDGHVEPCVAQVADIPQSTYMVIMPVSGQTAEVNLALLHSVHHSFPTVRVLAYIAPGPDQVGDVHQAMAMGFHDAAAGDVILTHKLAMWQEQFVRATDYSTLRSVIDEMAAKPALSDVLRIAIQRLSGLFSIERASVVVLKPDENVAFVVIENQSSQLENMVIQLHDYPELREVIRRREPLIISDVFADSLMASVLDKIETAHTPHRSAVLFPLLRKEVVVGILFLRGRAPLQEPYGRLMEVGRLIASVTSVALGNALEQDILLSTQRDLLRKQEDARQQLLNLRQFSDVFEQSFDGILITDISGKVRYTNPSAGAMLQTKPESLRGTNFFSLLSATSLTIAKRAYQNDSVGDAYGYVDLNIPDETGQETVLSAAIRPLAEDGGVLVNFRDVTELREIESELRQTKEFLENLIQSSVDAIVAADVDGRVILFNRAAEQILGYAARDVVGRMDMAAFFEEGEGEDVVRRLRSEAFGGRGRLELVRKDLQSRSGGKVPVNLTAAIIYEGEREMATVGIFTDLRERLKMEEKLNQVQHRLRLTERQAVAMELAGAAAHELNQPLTSILGYAEILRKRVPEGDPNRKAAETICRETERMAAIVRKIGQITSYETRPYVGGAQILSFDPRTEAGGDDIDDV